MDEIEEAYSAYDACAGADRMAAGLSRLPDSVRGDLDEVLRLRAELQRMVDVLRRK